MPIGEFDWQPSWSLECERNWGEYKFPWVRVVGLRYFEIGDCQQSNQQNETYTGEKKWDNRSFLSMNPKCTSFWVNYLFSSTFAFFLKHFEPI